MSSRSVPSRAFATRKSVSLICAFSILLVYGQILLATPADGAPFDGGLSPTIFDSKADLNGDDAVSGRDDSNAFYGDTHIIDGQLDCDAWDPAGTNGNDATDTGDEGPAGDGAITGADDCTLIGVDGTEDGVEIQVVNGSFVTRDGAAIPNGTALPTVFNDGDPDNTGVGPSDFAWSTIDGRVDANGDETIDGDDCHLGLIGQTVDAGLQDPHDGADVLASDGTGTNQCTGLEELSAAEDDGLVDLNSDGNITLAGDTCNNGCFLDHNVREGVVQTTGSPSTTVPTSSPFTGGFSPTIYGGLADLNGDGTVTDRDDSNAFYGDTHIIDGGLDCNAWTTENDGADGDDEITSADDCTLIGVDGTPDGVEITVVNGQFSLRDGAAIPDGTPLPTVFNSGDPDNTGVGPSDFAWSTIDGRVDANGDETIDGDDCHLGLIGQTVDAGLQDPHDGADVLASDGTGTNQCTGLEELSAAEDDGLVDLNSDGNITFDGDTCTNGCFFGHDVLEGVVQEVPQISINDVVEDEDGISATFTVTLSDPSGSTVTVAFATANGTATAGSDYTARSGTLTFTPGDTSETISVVVTNDSVDEPNETFFVNLSNPSNATIADSQGQGTITDDDPPPGEGDRPGIVRDATWFLNNDFDSSSDITPFVYGRASDIPIAGDWDGDGTSTPGIIRGNVWFLNNGTDGNADIPPFAYGSAGDIPIVGDWDGDGTSTPGVIRGNVWFLNNEFDSTSNVPPFAYGSATDFPVAGDWDNDDDETPGVVRGNVWFLNNEFDSTSDVTPFAYGSSTDLPVTGDWDGDGDTTPGVIRGNFWFLNNNTDASADITPFGYGRATDFAIVGDWNG